MSGHVQMAGPKVSYHVRNRRGYPIHGYIGGNGAGKSLAMVLDSLPTLAAGRTVLGTVRLLDPVTGEAHPQWEPLDDPAKLVEAYRCDVLLDEVAGVMSSRESSNLPNIIETNLQQLRRGDVTVRWSAPSWRRADTIIRECTQGVTVCEAKSRGQKVVEFEDGLERQWKSKSRMKWKTYDANDFEEWSKSQSEKLSPKVVQRFNRLSDVGQYVSASYDTFAPVLRWSLASDSGRCVQCAGYKPRRKCSCEQEDGPQYAGSRRLLKIAESDDTPAVDVEFPSVDTFVRHDLSGQHEGPTVHSR
ncbi:MAG: hypothetical protein M1337_02660 [Actinobacteria bacterium]|nr:hypothetical protein [Actinomycetota bacterium]